MNQRRIPFGEPWLGEAEEKAVTDVLRSGWLAHGPKVKEFEQAFAAYLGVKHAVSVSSCTAALHLSLLALGIGPGDEVIVPAQTHVATAHAVLYVGARPVFADVEPRTGTISPASIRRALTPRTRAVIVVHFAGLPCDMDEIARVAGDGHLAVVEDCAHAVGTTYRGRRAGTMGAAGCFSFYPVKHITTGEGGMLTTDDDRIAALAHKQRAFGIDVPAFYRQKPGVYDTPILGYNFRMTDIEAAIGICQLDQVDGRIERRIANAGLLTSLLKDVAGLELPVVPSYARHSFLFYQLTVTAGFPLTRDELLAVLKRSGVGASIYYATPVPLMTLYRRMYGHREGEFPQAERVAAETVALPVNPRLSAEEMSYIGGIIREASKTGPVKPEGGPA